MEPWVLVVIAAICASALLSYWKQYSYSLIGSAVCVFSYIVMRIVGNTNWDATEAQVAFSPVDLTDPGRLYSVVTSMFAHVSDSHLMINLVVLILMGLVLEQRIGTRPFIVLYFGSGLAGTLVFAGMHWGDAGLMALGASGAICGVLGAFGRLYPNDQVSLFFIVPMPAYAAVALLVLLQFLLIPFSTGIAYEAHLGGLAAGILLAPIIVRLPQPKRKIKRIVSLQVLRKLTTTPELRSIFKRIEDESDPDVRNAWIEHFLSKAKCPHCGAPLRLRKGELMCEKGHLL